MSQRLYISAFELTLIRIGYAKGVKSNAVGKFIGRHDVTVRKHVARMVKDGTINDLPFDFIVDDLAKLMAEKSK